MPGLRRSIALAALGVISLSLASPAHAGAGAQAVKLYKKELGRVVARQKTYEAKALDKDLRGAYDTYVAPWSNRGGPGAPKVINYDFSGYAGVYEHWASYDEEKGDLALSMAAVDGEDVAKRLVETLLGVVGEIAKQEQVICKARPKSGYICDQIPAIKRFGAQLHRDALVEAMGKLRDPEALKYLTGKGWDKAAKSERKWRTDRARIAVLDGLAGTGSAQVEGFLAEAAGSKEPRIRIAALSGLARVAGNKEALRKRIEGVAEGDACFAVRRAARDLLVSIDEKPEGEEEGEKPDEPKAPAKGTALFGIPVTSERIVVLLDASSILVRPADIELSKEKTWREWRSIAERDRDYVTQFDLLRSAVRDLVKALPASARFNLLVLNSSSTITPFWPKGVATASESVKKKADAFLDEVLVGGWAPQIAGIWEAYRIAGCGPWVTATQDAPEVEEIFLLGNGTPRGGAFLYAPAIIDEVERRHRFRRIPIHTVRVGDRDEPAEELMKGIAEVTGGRYVWKKKPD